MAVVARLLRGEPLDVVAGSDVVAKLTEWRDRALRRGVGLKERERDDREDESPD